MFLLDNEMKSNKQTKTSSLWREDKTGTAIPVRFCYWHIALHKSLCIVLWLLSKVPVPLQCPTLVQFFIFRPFAMLSSDTATHIWNILPVRNFMLNLHILSKACLSGKEITMQLQEVYLQGQGKWSGPPWVVPDYRCFSRSLVLFSFCPAHPKSHL